jgi:hypothetical protein
MPGTAEEYLRMVRRQAHGIPDVVCRPLAPTQVRWQLDSSNHAFARHRVSENCKHGLAHENATSRPICAA